MTDKNCLDNYYSPSYGKPNLVKIAKIAQFRVLVRNLAASSPAVERKFKKPEIKKFQIEPLYDKKLKELS